jgi:hypothetical protein
MTITDGRGGTPDRKSGQRVSTVLWDGERSLGCWTDRNRFRPSGVNAGLQHSEPLGGE